MSRMNSVFRLLVVGVLCAALTTLPISKVSAASLVDYQLLLFAILLLAASDVLEQTEVPQGSEVVVTQLQAAAKGAQAANIVGNRAVEVSRLSKAIGSAEALMGMTAACTNCGDFRSTLQQVIGLAALLKTNAVGASASCQPNGVIGPNEQCDPLAVPTGCPVNGVTVTYCSEECRCASLPTTPSTGPFEQRHVVTSAFPRALARQGAKAASISDFFVESQR